MTKKLAKKTYNAPTIKQWGTVVDLTRTGTTNSGGDAKTGSVSSMGL